MPEVKKYLSNNPVVYVQNKTLINELNKYYSTLSKELLANYLCYYYIQSQSTYLNFYDNEIFKMSESQSNSKSSENQSNSNESNENSIEANINSKIEKQFPLVADHLFVAKCVGPQKIENVKKIFERVRVSFF